MNTPLDKQKPRDVTLPTIGLALFMAIAGGLWVAKQDARPVNVKAPILRPAMPTAPPESAPATPSALPPPLALAPGATASVADAVPREEEERIFKWLTESETPAAAAEAMLANWNQLSESGKLAAARHVVNLVPDEHFAPMEGLLLDAEIGPEVKEVIFADLLNRPDEIKWPLFLKVMKQQGNPLSLEARRMLSIVLGVDLKDDWIQWQDRVQRDLLNSGAP